MNAITATTSSEISLGGKWKGRVWKGLMWLGRQLASLVVAVVLLLVVAFEFAKASGKSLWQWIRKYSTRMRLAHGQMRRTLFLMLVGSVWGFGYLYNTAPQFSAIFAGPLVAAIGCILFYVIVKYGHPEINLIHELVQEHNEAVPRYFQIYGFIIAGGVVAALLAAF